MDITVITVSGGAIRLSNAFIIGNNVAGDVNSKTIVIKDDDISSITQH